MDIQRADAGKRRQRRRIIAGSVGMGFALLAVLALGFTSRAPALNRDKLWSNTVQRGELIVEVAATGTLVAPELRSITSHNEGVVERIRVLPGRAVEAEDILLDMSSPQLEEELAQSRLKLQAAHAQATLHRVELENQYLDSVAQLANAESEYTVAKLEMDAHRHLAAQHVSSAIEVERTRLRAEQGLKRLEAERARHASFEEYRNAKKAASDAEVAEAQQRVARLARNVADLQVRAGVRGVVQEINVAEGERVATGKVIARVVNPDHLIARVQISERDATDVQLDMIATLNVGQHTLTGEVERVAPTVRDQLVEVDLALTTTPLPSLRPDLSVTARIELARLKDVLMLERPVGLADGAKEIDLYRYAADGNTADRRRVTLGRISARQVEVVAGLDAGDMVILSDLASHAAPTLRIR